MRLREYNHSVGRTQTCWKLRKVLHLVHSHLASLNMSHSCVCALMASADQLATRHGWGKKWSSWNQTSGHGPEFFSYMHCETQIWAECIDELDDVTTIRKSEVHQLCTCTGMHKELYACTGQCARRYGAAELLNHRKWTSFIHAVVVRVVNGFAQTLYEVKGLESCNYCYSLHTLGVVNSYITMRNLGGMTWCWEVLTLVHGTYRHSSILGLEQFFTWYSCMPLVILGWKGGGGAIYQYYTQYNITQTIKFPTHTL